MRCAIPDCDREATIDLDKMPVCAGCDYLIDHPEIDEPEAILGVYAKFD